MSSNDNNDQNDWRLKLEATTDLLDGGATLGEVSARAARVAKPDALIAAVDAMVAKGATRPALEDFAFALMYWVRSVEARLSALQGSGGDSPADAAGSSESEHGKPTRLGDAPAARTALPMDATTAALERAGEALRAEQERKAAAAPAQCKCGGTFQGTANGRVCNRCEQYVRKPLAQSPWVVEHEPATCTDDEGQEVERLQSLLEQAKRRIADCESEIEELKRTRKVWVAEHDDRAAELRARDTRIADLEALVQRLVGR